MVRTDLCDSTKTTTVLQCSRGDVRATSWTDDTVDICIVDDRHPLSRNASAHAGLLQRALPPHSRPEPAARVAPRRPGCCHFFTEPLDLTIAVARSAIGFPGPRDDHRSTRSLNAAAQRRRPTEPPAGRP